MSNLLFIAFILCSSRLCLFFALLYRKLESGGSAKRSDGGASDSPLSPLNFSVEKNLTFDKLDEEFYDILKHQLKLDIKDGMSLSPTMEKDEENLDQPIEEKKTTENKTERGELVEEATEEEKQLGKSQEILAEDQVNPENSTGIEGQSKDLTPGLCIIAFEIRYIIEEIARVHKSAQSVSTTHRRRIPNIAFLQALSIQIWIWPSITIYICI